MLLLDPPPENPTAMFCSMLLIVLFCDLSSHCSLLLLLDPQMLNSLIDELQGADEAPLSLWSSVDQRGLRPEDVAPSVSNRELVAPGSDRIEILSPGSLFSLPPSVVLLMLLLPRQVSR